MRQDPYKKLMFEKWLIPRLVGAGIILITVIIVVILTTMQQSEQLYLEGAAKSIPLVSNDKLKMFGDKELKSKIGKSSLDTEIMKFKFYIITNSVLSKGVKSIEVPELLDRPVELNLWNLERFFQLSIR